MEQHQRQHISQNRALLEEYTQCSPALFARLEEAGLISRGEKESIKHEGGPIAMASKFYDIIVGKVNAYDKLIEALQNTTQSGAAKILREISKPTTQPNSSTTGVISTASASATAESSNRNLLLGDDCDIPEIVELWKSSSVAATLLDRFTDLGRRLKLSSVDIKQFKKKVDKEPEEFFEVIIGMLETFKQTAVGGGGATVGMLIEALEKNPNPMMEFSRIIKRRYDIA